MSPPGPSNKPLALKLGGSKRQRLGKFVAVTVICPDDPCTTVATGSLNVAGAAKRFKLGKVTRSLARGRRATLKLPLPRTARKAALRALKRHKKVTARISVAVRNSAGASGRGAEAVRLRA